MMAMEVKAQTFLSSHFSCPSLQQPLSDFYPNKKFLPSTQLCDISDHILYVFVIRRKNLSQAGEFYVYFLDLG
jgi:hypothetical protein